MTVWMHDATPRMLQTLHVQYSPIMSVLGSSGLFQQLSLSHCRQFKGKRVTCLDDVTGQGAVALILKTLLQTVKGKQNKIQMIKKKRKD